MPRDDKNYPKCKCGCGGTAALDNGGYCRGHEPQQCYHLRAVALVDFETGEPRGISYCLACQEVKYH